MLCNKAFCEFPCLQILYLHGNSIKDIKEVDKLAALASLRKLALHGNLMDSTKVSSNCTHVVVFQGFCKTERRYGKERECNENNPTKHQ